MTIACPAPDPTLGVVLRLSAYLDCQGRALGENGFEALTGGPLVSGMLSGAVTIFVALIGYRMILGTTPGLRDGVGWAIRLGFVLALTTSWPAFQTLVYRVATDGPQEIAATLLPAAGLPPADIALRMQDAYTAIGGGGFSVAADDGSTSQTPPSTEPASPPIAPTAVSMSASPLSASLLAMSAVGVGAALRLTVGMLVAIGPLMVIGLLFDATLGLVAGWIRTLAGAALAVLSTSIVSACELLLIESELAKAQDIQLGSLAANTADPQGFATIAAVCAAMTLVSVYAGFKAAAGLRLPSPAQPPVSRDYATRAAVSISASRSIATDIRGRGVEPSPVETRTRVASISDALTAAARRDAALESPAAMTATRAGGFVQRLGGVEGPGTAARQGIAGRRTGQRRTRSAARRDRPA